jgi:hypothetical protein
MVMVIMLSVVLMAVVIMIMVSFAKGVDGHLPAQCWDGFDTSPLPQYIQHLSLLFNYY